MSVAIPAAPRIEGKRRFLGLFGSSSADQPLISDMQATPFAESFRLLALNVESMLAYDARKAVVVMSGYAKDGRSLVAANLALALSEQRQVLLIEESGRSSSLSHSLTRAVSSTLGAVGNGIPEDMRRSVVHTAHPRLYVMPRASQAGVTDEDVDAAVADASNAGMYTIIDSAPALSSSSAFREAQLAGNVLYVVRGTTTDVDAHRRVREQLERLNINVVGVLLNEH